jgi:cation transport regulator
MAYESIEELPVGVRNVLPEHAQEIYKEAFNHAYEEYANPEKRRGEESQEEVASKVAWAAVERGYAKNEDGKWQKK